MEENRPFFSIIVPVYQAEMFLSACIQSILSQTYRDFNLYLIDDGSLDDSGVICDAYQEQNPGRVYVFHQQNQGPLSARRAGMIKADGLFLLQVDSDDILRSDALDRIRRALAFSGADLALFQSSRDPDFRSTFRQCRFDDGQVFEGQDKQALYRLLMNSSSLNNLFIKAASREIIDLGKDYSVYQHVINGEDLLLSLPLLDNAKRIVFIKENLYYYRPNPSGITHNYSFSHYQSVRDVAIAQMQYAKKWDNGNGELITMANDSARTICTSAVFRLLKSKNSWVDKERIIKVMANDSFFRSAMENSRQNSHIIKTYLAKAVVHLWKIQLYLVHLGLGVFFHEK